MTGATLIVCFHCVQPGHLCTECPKHFNIQFMDLEGRQSFAQDEFMVLDVPDTNKKVENPDKDVETLGFGLDSK